MFLERILIEDIRSIGRAELEFTQIDAEQTMRKWSLLVGDNGSGKSTALKAIALVLAGSDALPHVIGEPGSWVRRGRPTGRILATLRTAGWEERRVELVIGADDLPSDVLRRNVDGLARLDEALRHAAQNYFVVGYGPYRRLSPPSIAPSAASARLPLRAQSMLTLFDRDASVTPLASWAMALEYRRGADGLDVVRDAMNALLPDISFESIDKARGTLMFSTPDGLLPLEQISDGYQNVAAWIGDLLTRVTDSFAHHNHPLRARGLLLIDEVDAHLHPTWQRRLREFLDTTLPNFQIVATTHSALTLQQSHEGEAVILKRGEAGDVTAQPFPGDPSKLRLHQIYDMAFGITSLDSWEIEQSKQQYRELTQRAETLSPEETRTLEDVRRTLEQLPADPAPALGNESLDAFFRKLDRATETISGQIGRGRE